MSAFVVLTAMPAEWGSPKASATVGSAYPGLASGVLMYARLGDLPGGTLLRSGRVEITADELNSDVLRAPESMREQLRKNGFFLLEQLATRKLLVQVAKGMLTGPELNFPRIPRETSFGRTSNRLSKR